MKASTLKLVDEKTWEMSKRTPPGKALFAIKFWSRSPNYVRGGCTKINNGKSRKSGTLKMCFPRASKFKLKTFPLKGKRFKFKL